MELHFYPGQHLLIVLDKGLLLRRVDAQGGPAKMGSDPRMAEEPTWPGHYIIDKAYPYQTPTWPLSKIIWGTPLRDMPGKNDVWYELKSGKWGSLKNDIGISRLEIIKLFYDLYKEMRVPPKWVFNDFGPISIRWFKDLNKNREIDGKEALSGQMFHTTPSNEAEHARGLPVKLEPSHGCIHLKPADRDLLLSMGAFKPKTSFIVHKYHEKY